MSLYVAYYNPYSPYYQVQTLSDRLAHLRHHAYPTQAPSSAYRRSSHFTDDFVRRMDMIDVLGGEDASGCQVGHSGCVNALAWSQSGDCLATGSDDRRVILWRMGTADESPSIDYSQSATPKLCLAQSEVIETGHRANIFSVKWAPNSGDRRLFTCAGDSQMRVFDLTRASAFVNKGEANGKEYKLWPEEQGACTRVLRCHSSRAKRISTENSPDVFLSCAEDGEVRQTDLRVPHTCSASRGFGQGCPRPLVQFQMELYSLSVSKLEPWLFAVAGTSDKAFLMDRRMVPRHLRREWGCEVPSETAALTHCVRRLGREPFDESDNRDEDDGVMAIRRRRFNRAHITAVKIAESNGRDMIASYSGDGLYKFDIKREPGMTRKSHTISTNKRRKTSRSGSPTTKTMSDAEVTSARRRIIGYLFPKPLQNTRPALRHEIWRDLSNLEASSSNLDAELSASEKATIALCRALMSVRRANMGDDEETSAAALHEAGQALRPYAGHPIGQEIVPLLDEYLEAEQWKAVGESAKIRILLIERSKDLIRHQWEASAHPAQAQSSTPDLAMRPADVSEGIKSNGSLHNQDEDRRSALVEESSSQASTSRRLNEEMDLSDDDDDDDEESASPSLVARAFQSLDESSAEGSIDDREDDDDGSDGGSEDSELGLMNELMSDDDDDDDADDEERHGISGGNAPIVYPEKRFTGHMNVETVKDCGFVGSNDEYIWSGSDCGHFFIWRNDEAGELKGIWKGDDSVVNVLAQHPTLPVCAVSGIDDTVKVFGPRQGGSEKSYRRFDMREEIIDRNARNAGGR